MWHCCYHCQLSVGPKALGLVGVVNQETDCQTQKNDQEMAHLGHLGCRGHLGHLGHRGRLGRLPIDLPPVIQWVIYTSDMTLAYHLIKL